MIKAVLSMLFIVFQKLSFYNSKHYEMFSIFESSNEIGMKSTCTDSHFMKLFFMKAFIINYTYELFLRMQSISCVGENNH